MCVCVICFGNRLWEFLAIILDIHVFLLRIDVSFLGENILECLWECLWEYPLVSWADSCSEPIRFLIKNRSNDE